MATTEPTTALDALLAELHVSVLNVHDSIKALKPELQSLLVDAPAAIRDATSAAIANLEKGAEAQAYWIEQETLKDRDAFIARQQEVNASFVAEMKAVIAVQNTALESVLLRVGVLTTEAIKKEVAASVAAAAAGIAADAKKTAEAQAGLGIVGVVLVGLGGATIGAAIIVGAVVFLHALA